jgi:hypothetical protein
MELENSRSFGYLSEMPLREHIFLWFPASRIN